MVDGLVGVCACAVYQLGPRSWKPDASLSQTVADVNVEQTCRMSREILSEIPESTYDAYQLLQSAGDIDQSSSHPASQSNNSNSNATAELPTPKPTKDTSSTHDSKWTWSAIDEIKQSLANEDDTESVLLLFVVTWCAFYTPWQILSFKTVDFP